MTYSSTCSPFISVIIVTYNSQPFLAKALACLAEQTQLANEIIIVDTGSQDLSYLVAYQTQENVKIFFAEKEAGFCKGNNLGFAHVHKNSDYVLLLNPDAYLTAHFLKEATIFMQKPDNRQCGALTGLVIGYDNVNDQPRAYYDTTGIFSHWYGKWYDRAQGQPVGEYCFRAVEKLPAICGALFFCRKAALDQVLLRETEILDATFYMYKEDIDLSLRLRKKGWTLSLVPYLLAYHCRGWNPNRSLMPKKLRLCSARNELFINFYNYSFFGTFYSIIKYSLVKFLNI